MICPKQGLELVKIFLFGKGDKKHEPEGRVWKFVCPEEECRYSPENRKDVPYL